MSIAPKSLDERAAAALAHVNEARAANAELNERIEKTTALCRSSLTGIHETFRRFDEYKQKMRELQEACARAFAANSGADADGAVLDECERHALLGGAISLAEVARRLGAGQFKNVIVLIGAGVSTAAGIPDFRTPGTGLYSQLERYHLPSAHAIFDIDFFRSNPQPFCSLAREMWPERGRFAPTRTHRFLALLERHGVLRRVYTQNIDGLEVCVSEACVCLCVGVRMHARVHEHACMRVRALARP